MTWEGDLLDNLYQCDYRLPFDGNGPNEIMGPSLRRSRDGSDILVECFPDDESSG